ncbi:MAG TPA: peptidylprolyl isomerase [Anaerolineales bacterium]|nr:peptidylprolyl isomerase [Anaerolineales bacterium]
MTSKKRKKKAEQEKAQKRSVIIAAVVLVLAIVSIWIASSAKNNTAIPPADSPPVHVPPPTVPPPADEKEPTADAPQIDGKHYDEAPPMTIDTEATYLATFTMESGDKFVIELYPDKAPITVNNFVFLVRDKYYDNTTFHRVLEDFMAQGGDPSGTGTGDMGKYPGYQFVNEDSDLTFDKEGVVAMANAGRDTNGSQFFITFAPAPYLNGGYTIFGQVIEGMDVVHNITRRDPQLNPDFEGDLIESVTIEEK